MSGRNRQAPTRSPRRCKGALTEEDGPELLARFNRWNEEPLNLPGVYYLQVVNSIFRENRIASGSFVALGRHVDLRKVTMPIFLLAGLDDDVVPPEQALATARSRGDTARPDRGALRAVQPPWPVHGREDPRACLARSRGVAARSDLGARAGAQRLSQAG